MSRAKINPEKKKDAISRIKAGEESISHAAERLGVALASVQQWITIYNSYGMDGFKHSAYTHYSKELKEQAVLDYLSGKGSQADICERYGIRSKSKLQLWIKKYNGHEELKSSGIGGNLIMTKGRKTNFDERVEIASYCIEHNHNYNKAAEKYNVSYQQARNYTVKYENQGIQGLQDKRGKRKLEASLTEIEKLRAEIKLEKAMRKKAEMELSFLKKLDEIERRWD